MVRLVHGTGGVFWCIVVKVCGVNVAMVCCDGGEFC